MDAIRRAQGAHAFGVTKITERGHAHADMLMDFYVIRLRQGERFISAPGLERALLLVYGGARFEWDGQVRDAQRDNCFDVAPIALHAGKDSQITVIGTADDTEINYLATENEKPFEARFFAEQDTPDELRGKGLMRETSTRIVRTIFDDRNAPQANLVLGEVIGFPGKWSSYPPHHHPQPEIYYYKTNPEGGFGYAELGEDVCKVHNNDTVCIAPGLTHPHCTAPGYALWYLWAIRHLEGQRYGTPTFLKEHLWVQEPDARYWGDGR